MYDGQLLHLATNLYTESGLSSVPKYIFTRYPRLRPRGINPNPPYKVKLVKTSSPREGFHLMTRRTQDSNLQWLSPSPAFKAGSLPIRIIRHLNGRQKGTSAYINNKRGLQLIRICLLPPTPQSIGGHLTGSVARRSTFFIFRIPLMVRVEGLEPSRAKPNRFSYYSMSPWPLTRCSLDYVFSISYDLGGWYIVSTHLGYSPLSTAFS